MQKAQDVPGQLRSATGESREPEGTFPGVGLGRGFCEGVIAARDLLAKGLPRLQSSPACLWDLLERGDGNPEVSWAARYRE